MRRHHRRGHRRGIIKLKSSGRRHRRHRRRAPSPICREFGLQLVRRGLEVALLLLGERLEREVSLGLLAQRAQLEVVGGVQRGVDGDVVLDELKELLLQAIDFLRRGRTRGVGRGGA